MNNHKDGIHTTLRIVFLMMNVIDILLEFNAVCVSLLTHHLHKCAYPALGWVTRAIEEDECLETEP